MVCYTTSEVWISTSKIPEDLQTTIDVHLIIPLLVCIAVTQGIMYGQKRVTILALIKISILISLTQTEALRHRIQDIASLFSLQKDRIHKRKARLETDDWNKHQLTITSNENPMEVKLTLSRTDTRKTNSSEEFYTLKANASQVSVKENIPWIFSQHPSPNLDNIPVFYTERFEPLSLIISQIAEGKSPRPQVTMRYELLRLCTLRTYPKDNKPFRTKYAAAGFYYASDGDGVVCYCCGIRRYGWVETDDPMEVHQIINPRCKFLINNREHNVPSIANGPLRKKVAGLDIIPDCALAKCSGAVSNRHGVPNEIPMYEHMALTTFRKQSFNTDWANTQKYSPAELADGGFFFTGFEDCIRCFFCGIGLRRWDKEDDMWVEHARWSQNCTFLIQKKGQNFVDFVKLTGQQLHETGESHGTGMSDIICEGADAGDTPDQIIDVVIGESHERRVSGIISEGTNACDAPDEITNVVVGASRDDFHSRLVMSNVQCAESSQHERESTEGTLPVMSESHERRVSGIISEGTNACDAPDEITNVVVGQLSGDSTRNIEPENSDRVVGSGNRGSSRGQRRRNRRGGYRGYRR
ncbi:baculoviral IAP repeat-containing protein 7-A-like isoform X2 [Dreissena polymorpha]|uniref:baculoviral IAP repeat-containing protein 7-A-like isoform X2 n=1 Tax=Dreissena polymorpha TaxID=45954 RepID=UPI002264D3C2|nr:baculoviral IAP repeat-containing protein 7-A-like isoform X2 [Dreissena polymorpha]